MRYLTLKTGLMGLSIALALTKPSGLANADEGLELLSDPYLQLPQEDSVIVAWFTEFEGTGHEVVYGAELDQVVSAESTRMSRKFEDNRSDLFDAEGNRRFAEFTERPVWRHEATVTGLQPGERVPYRVRSMDGAEMVESGIFSLQGNPDPGTPVKIVLSSDQQNRKMSPGTFQKLVETVGHPDAVLFAGDFVDTPHRASEWFDRENESRPAFFPSLQGTFQELFPEHPYTGGEVLQHAALFGTIGNHESPGRFSKHVDEQAGLNAVDNDPQPRWYAEYRYERELAAGNLTPPEDPAEAAAFREAYIQDWSFEHTAYYEMWNHPEDGPAGESYWAHRFGDVFIISMNVSRVWRNWNPGRGKFSETEENLNNPDEWGFGDMFFEYYGVGTEQYEWLESVLQSEAFQNAKYRVVMGHQTMFGLGDNSVPVMADPIATITYLDESGNEQTMQRSWPADATTFAEDIEPLIEREAITGIYYEYPEENDIWRNDIEPLLKEYGVQLVHTGHSHLWNRARSGALHYLETSNYGNSFGAGYADDSVSIARAPWARFPGDENGVEGPDPADYDRFGDSHDREIVFPTELNPEVYFGESDSPVPFVSSNNIGVFTVLDTGDGKVRSYAYDWTDPDSDPVLFDVFSLQNPFRVKPYLTAPSEDGMTVTWFSDENLESTITLSGGNLDEPLVLEVEAEDLTDRLGYSEAEEEGRSDPRFEDMRRNANFKYQVVLDGLEPGTEYAYSVSLGDVSESHTFRTAPSSDTMEPIRFIVHADSETEPDTRDVARDWTPGAQHINSSGRPDSLPEDSRGRDFYLFSQGDGFANNIATWSERDPDFVVMPGDLTQGGNYQRAWDEFFRHMAGERDHPLSSRPLLPALGNWENFGAINGGYDPAAVYAARQRFKAYFDKPQNGTPEHRNQYYRIDYGPVTVITLDSSNGLPDGDRSNPSEFDTQSNVSIETYPGDDLADINPGSAQWEWAEEQLADARRKGQVIFVQFHHSPYSSGTHGAPMTAVDADGAPLPGNTGQAGTPMRVYSPLFEEHGVVAVFSGHSELFERSVVNGIHYYDTGVAGDGMRGSLDPEFAEANNPYNVWLAHRDEPELWSGNRLLAGGKHYGHLEVEVQPLGDGRFEITFTPVHVFPLMDNAGTVYGFERRVYNDQVVEEVELGAFKTAPVLEAESRNGASVVFHSWREAVPEVVVHAGDEPVEAGITVESTADGSHFLNRIVIDGLQAGTEYRATVSVEGFSREVSFRTDRFFLSEPMLQLPTEDSVRVVWYTEFEGSDHQLRYGEDLERTAEAVSTRMTRMFEDSGSDQFVFDAEGNRSRAYSEFTERPVWRHEAVATGLEPGVRIPYQVSSSDGTVSSASGVYSLQPLPAEGQEVQILLTSDQQNRTMSPATFQKVEETLGMVDLVLFAGDYVDNPHRASEWFDRENERRPAFFPSLQGTYQELFPDWPYRGGAILQHAPVKGVIGNHESPGRFGKHAEESASINAVDGDPQPRWYAEYRYNREVEAGNLTPPADPDEAAAFKADFIRDWSYEHTAFVEMWNHPDDGPRGEEYWSMSYGDVFLIGMNVSRVWRNWNPGRGKFSEAEQHLNNPDEWGFGDMFFEYYGVGSEQYEWLLGVLQSEEFANAETRIVIAHQTMFGLGDNSLPVMADPVATITYTDENGNEQTMEKVWPADADSFVSDILPLVEREAITSVTYEYPLENDIWLNDIEPLLQEYGVDLVHTGHSHLWNRAIVGDLHYIETSNYGNSFGVGYAGWAARAPWARFPGDNGGVVGPTPEFYPRFGDAHGRPPVYPNLANPMMEMENSGLLLPFVSSNNIGVFTVFDSGTGMVDSYAFDTRDPESDVVLFDRFPIDLSELPDNPFQAAMNFGGNWKWSEWMGWVHTGSLPWVYTVDHGWLLWNDAGDGFGEGEHLLEDLTLGMLYTREDLYPLIYSYASETWFYYQTGTRDPRLFFNLETREWIEVE